MNTNLTVFQFESSSIRTVDLEGVVWFVGKDVAGLLGYSRANDAIQSHCKSAVALNILKKQCGEMAYCNEINELHPRSLMIQEADVFRLIIHSQLESAEKFEKWVMEEVLPTIRKTGQYQIPVQQPLQLTQHDLATRQLKNELEIAALLECPLHIAQQEVVKSVRKDFKVDFSHLLKHAKAQQNILPTEIMLEPTELGLSLLLGSGKATNRILESLGLQYRNVNGQWTPTAIGRPLCQSHAWTSGNKSGYNLKWNVKAIGELLKD